MAVELKPCAQRSSWLYPAEVVQISRCPSACPTGLRAAATWTSAWVSTPTMTAAVSCGMLTVAILVSVTAVVEGWCVSGVGGQDWDGSLAHRLLYGHVAPLMAPRPSR